MSRDYHTFIAPLDSTRESIAKSVNDALVELNAEDGPFSVDEVRLEVPVTNPYDNYDDAIVVARRLEDGDVICLSYIEHPAEGHGKLWHKRHDKQDSWFVYFSFR